MCATYSSAATPPRLCWTGQLTEQVLTARSCTCTAQQATSCGAARMGSGGTLSTIIKARRCDIPPDACAPQQLAAYVIGTGRAADRQKVLAFVPERHTPIDARSRPAPCRPAGRRAPIGAGCGIVPFASGLAARDVSGEYGDGGAEVGGGGTVFVGCE